MIEIKPLDSQRKKATTIFPPLPFSGYYIAQKGGGKTTLLLNALYSPEIYKNKFNRILWFSPTAGFDEKVIDLKKNNPTIENFPLKREMRKRQGKDAEIMDAAGSGEEKPSGVEIIEEFTMEIMNELLSSQKKVINSFNKGLADSICIILDDMVNSKLLRSKEFTQFLFNSRHYKFSIIIISQSYYSLAKPLRLNMSQVLIFENGNKAELGRIYEENSLNLSKQEWMRAFKMATSLPFSFLNINYSNVPGKRLFNCGKHLIVFK